MFKKKNLNSEKANSDNNLTVPKKGKYHDNKPKTNTAKKCFIKRI